MFVIIQAHHGYQEALDDFPRLPPVIGLRVGALQTVQGSLDCLEQNKRESRHFLFLAFTIRSLIKGMVSLIYTKSNF